jgi:hypothetical protein
MSVNTAIMVNAILDLSALGALAYVCRHSFRTAATRAETSIHAHVSARSRREVARIVDNRR